jgi:hypothetical protein
MSAREYLSMEHFDTQHGPRLLKGRDRLDYVLRHRSILLGPEPASEDGVTIQPLFRPFLNLPLELQQMILGTAAGVTGQWHKRQRDRKIPHPPIPLATIFQLSKDLNSHLVPWLYRTTDFHFGTTGFTNFLLLSGPLRRAELKRITFRFNFHGSNALVHFLRWLAPEPIIDLFDPPVPTTPPALCLFWRCQIKDLVKELRLAVLTIDINGIPGDDLPMIVRILRAAFGDVECFRFKNKGQIVEKSEARLNKLREARTWRQECRGWFERRKNDRHSWPGMSSANTKMSVQDLEREMDRNGEFFDQVEYAWA